MRCLYVVRVVLNGVMMMSDRITVICKKCGVVVGKTSWRLFIDDREAFGALNGIICNECYRGEYE